MADDEISYMALDPGTSVESASGTAFGTVEHVLQVPSENLFDGVVVATARGLRFVDRDEITSMTRSVVTCSLTDEEVARLPAPSGPPVYHVHALDLGGRSLSSHLGRIFGRRRWLEEERD